MNQPPSPATATYYIVQMICGGIRFMVSQQEGERLGEILEHRTNADEQTAFVRCEDLSGCDMVLNLNHIEGIWFTSPTTREWDKAWTAEQNKDKDWSEPA